MKINIEVDTYDRQLTTDILGKKTISSGDKRDIYKNTTLEYQLTLKKFSIDEPDTILFTLDVEGDITTNKSIFASLCILSYSLDLWEISIRDIPVSSKFKSSFCAFFKTASGNVAGPA